MAAFVRPRSSLLIFVVMEKLIKNIVLSLPSTANVKLQIDDIEISFLDSLSIEAIFKLFQRVNVVSGTFPQKAMFCVSDGRLIFLEGEFSNIPCTAHLKDCYLYPKAPIFRFLRMIQFSKLKSPFKRLL